MKNSASRRESSDSSASAGPELLAMDTNRFLRKWPAMRAPSTRSAAFQRFLFAFLHLAQRAFCAARMRAMAALDIVRRRGLRLGAGLPRASIALLTWSKCALRRSRSRWSALRAMLRAGMRAILADRFADSCDGVLHGPGLQPVQAECNCVLRQVISPEGAICPLSR